MSSLYPLSPLNLTDESFKISVDTLDDLAEEELDPKSVTVTDLISGEGIATLDENGPGALQPKMLAAPKEMSMSEREKHFASGHLPYDHRCEICFSCKKPNVPHVKSHESERTIPLLAGDYGFAKDGMDDDNVTVLVLKPLSFQDVLCLHCGEQGIRPIGGRKS